MFLFDGKRRLIDLMKFEENGGGSGGNPDPSPDPSPSPDPEPKTFTQEELNSILASEKRKNSSSIYKELGFENPEDAKAFIEKYKEEEETKKDALTKAQEKAEALEKEKAAETSKALRVEHKFKAVELGCGPKAADDVVTLAEGKMTDGKDFEAALKEVKEAYPSMFEATNEGGSTGKGGQPPRNKNTGDSSGIGERLAKKRKSNVKKNDFFQN